MSVSMQGPTRVTRDFGAARAASAVDQTLPSRLLCTAENPAQAYAGWTKIT